jgi:hypothetical protein
MLLPKFTKCKMDVLFSVRVKLLMLAVELMHKTSKRDTPQCPAALIACFCEAPTLIQEPTRATLRILKVEPSAIASTTDAAMPLQ